MNYSKGNTISKDDSKAYDAAQYSLYQVSQNLEAIGWNGTGLLGIRKASYKKNKPFFLGDVLKMDKVAGEESDKPREKDFTPLLNSIINGDINVFTDQDKISELEQIEEDYANKELAVTAIVEAARQVIVGYGKELE